MVFNKNTALSVFLLKNEGKKSLFATKNVNANLFKVFQ